MRLIIRVFFQKTLRIAFPIYSVALLLVTVRSNAQGYCENLIPNPGFEEYKQLDENGAFLWSNVKEWNNVNLLPTVGASYSYFHTHSVDGFARLPNTGFATLSAHSGEAVIGFLGWQKKFPDYRVYFSAKLIHPMVPGKVYDVSFWITNGRKNWGGYGINCIGACFSEGPLDQTDSELVKATPQWMIQDVLFDTTWRQITFQILADKPYEYFTMGNFLPAANIENAQFLPNTSTKGPVAFYFVDDFSVTHEEPGFSFSIAGDTVLCPDVSLTLSVPLSGQLSYQWSTGSTEASVEVTSTGVYSATVTNVCGTFSDSIEITRGCVVPLIPNCFTPNDDQINDVFRMVPDPKIEPRSLQIYNRWGNLVFDSASGKFFWDGTVDGRPAPSDVYGYVLEYQAAGESAPVKVKGDVTLLR